MDSAASCSIQSAKGLPGQSTSRKSTVHTGEAGRWTPCLDLRRNTAICWRVDRVVRAVETAPAAAGDALIQELLDPGRERIGRAVDVGESAGCAGRRNKTLAELGLQKKDGHLGTGHGIERAVAPGRGAARGDAVGDEPGDEGVELLTVGHVREIRDPAVGERAAVPPGLGAVTGLRLPAGSAGDVAVIVAESTTSTFVAGAPPTVTVAPSSNSMPLIVIAVPPSGGPDVGLLSEKTMRCENSEVFPSGSVAVALTRAFSSTVTEQREVEARVAGAVRCDLRRADVVLALQELLGPVRAGGIRIEVEVERRSGRAVEDALDPRTGTLRHRGARREQDGVVLKPVRAAVPVTRVVDLDPEAAELDSQARPAQRTVLVDAVASDRDPLPAHGHAGAADSAVEGDEVGLTGAGPAHEVVASGDRDAGRVVSQIPGTGRVGAEEVSVDRIVRAAQADPGLGSPDHVAVAGRRPPDRVAAAARLDAFVLDSELDRAGGVGPDEVPANRVRRPGENDSLPETRDGVVLDDVARPGDRDAHRRGSAGGSEDGAAAGGQADEVAPDGVPRGRADVENPDAGETPADQVPRRGRRAADDGPGLARDLYLLVGVLVDAGAARRVGAEEAPLDLARVEAAAREGHAGIAVLDDQAPDDDVAGRDREAGPRRRGAVDDHLENRVQPLADGERVDEGAGLRVSVERGLGRDRRQRRRDRDRVRTAARDVECDRVVGAVRVRVEDRLAQGSCPRVAGVRHGERRREGRRGQQRGDKKQASGAHGDPPEGGRIPDCASGGRPPARPPEAKP